MSQESVHKMSNQAKNVVQKTPAATKLFLGAAVATGGYVAYRAMTPQQAKPSGDNVEAKSGTADGNFPTATPDARLSNPPGTKN